MADGSPEDVSIIASSSISASEMDINPNQRLSSVLLNEFNYLPWARAASLALGGRSKLGFINGSQPAPDASSPEFGGWLCKDQLVMSWLLNSMERKVAEIFSYSESSLTLWTTVKEMYGNQNNAARIFQLKKDISNIQQEGKSFVQHLGSLRSMWNELDVYRPHTTDSSVLLKRIEEDKNFQLLSSLSSEYEDLRSHILMNLELPSFTSVCATIQREEVRRKVMNNGIKTNMTEARAYLTNEKRYKGKNPHLKCLYCDNIGHVRDKCWILHPELKPDFMKDKSAPKTSRAYPRANTATSSSINSFDTYQQFTANPATLLNEFAAYLQQKKGRDEGSVDHEDGSTTALMGKFAGFLADADCVPQTDLKGIITAFQTALKINELHDFWVEDSGATDHMTNQMSKLHKFEKLHNPSHVSVANGEGARIDCITKRTIGEGFYSDGLYYISKNSSCRFHAKSKSIYTSIQEASLWHQRLAHPSQLILSTLFPDLGKESTHCETCHLSKATRLPLGSSMSRVFHLFELVHSDIWGPTSESFDGYKYFITFVDDYSKTTWLYLLKSKSEVMEVFKDFHNLVKNHFSSQIKTLRSDNGTEYTSQVMTQYLSNNGIIHQTSCVGTPQQNGVAERKNRDLLEKTRALMLQMNVPKRFWSQSVMTAAYLINRLPSRVLGFKSPIEIVKNRKVDLSHLKVFGCICFVHVQPLHRDKLDPRATKCIFLGYSSTQKGYKCYNPQLKRLIVSNDVKFHETNSYYSKSLDSTSQREISLDMFPLPRTEIPNNVGDQPHTMDLVAPNPPAPYDDNNMPVEDETLRSIHPEESSEESLPIIPRRNPTRERHPPARLQDFVTYKPKHPLSNYCSYQKLSPNYTAYLSNISAHEEPQSFQEANQSQVWQQAMQDELHALDQHKT
ncbi:hypothetical protein TB2_005960 [Malus domestica]